MKAGSKSGLTLVELMISVVIALGVGAAAIQFLHNSQRQTVSVIKRVQAHNYVDQIVTHLQHAPIKPDSYHFTFFPQIVLEPDYSVDVFLGSLTEGSTRHASITISWDWDGRENQMQMERTLIKP